MSETELITRYLAKLQKLQKGSGNRRLVVLSGAREWCQALISQIQLDLEQSLWVGDSEFGLIPPQGIAQVSAKQAHQFLGQDHKGIMFDAWSGFNPNGFGQVAGTLVAGGLFVLIIPPIQCWRDFEDPEYSSIAVHPYQPRDVGRRFIDHLCRTIRADQCSVLIEEGEALPGLPAIEISSRPDYEYPYLSEDQQGFVEKCRTILSKQKQIEVLTADRGRGKSAALGILAAYLMRQQGCRILLTAPSKGAIHSTVRMLETFLGDGFVKAKDRWIYGDSELLFQLPDKVIREQPVADLLLVDEAAAIPAPQLKAMLFYPRVIFATTIHGYEGTGQGFAVRFLPYLQYLGEYQQWRMESPIRWQENDPLEQFTYRALLMDAEPYQGALSSLTEESICYKVLDRDQLSSDLTMLRQVFGLLILAHYRTTPGDLRILLDSPNLEIWVACHRDNPEQVMATALIAREGPIPADLATAIMAGKRRPKGHLIPQTLLAHSQLAEAADTQGGRVMRIAVLPCLQRQGLGSQLLQAIEKHYSELDWIGTSFGATSGLYRFWRQQGMQLQRLGFNRDKVSGTHAAVMLKGLSPVGSLLQERAAQSCIEQLSNPDTYPDLEDKLLSQLLS